MIGRAARLAMACAGVIAASTPAFAQQPARQSMELAGGIVWAAPRSLGTVNADLLDSDGLPVTLFRAENETGPALGLEVILSQAVARRIDVEFAGSWTRVDARTSITGDFEDVPDVTVSETITRYALEGGVVWRFAERGRVAWFLRGSGGWMREVVGDLSLAENGILYSGGVGLKYWMSRRPTGQDQFGIRAEFRMMGRHDGIALEDESFRLWPAATVMAVARF